MRKALSKVGLGGSATPEDWTRAAVEVLPPIILAAIAGRLDDVAGVVGWGLSVVYVALAWIAWWPLVMRFAPWRRT